MASKKEITKLLTLSLAAGVLTLAARAASLPTIYIQGKQYYYYKVKKGDSPYGICKKYDWDEAQLRATNTNFAQKIAKGQTIYYPVEPSAQPTPVSYEKRKVTVQPQSVTHTVSRGETVYSLSALYSVPVDVIYNLNPETRHGLRVGQSITIAQPSYADVAVPFFYTVRDGDTLGALAERFNAGIGEILKENPGLSERNLKAGMNLRITPNSRQTVLAREVKESNTVVGFSPYKVEKNDNWDTIASKTGVDATTLKETNNTEVLPKKGEWITVPNMEMRTAEVVTEKPVVPDQTIGDRDKIYNRVHNLSKDNVVKIAVVLDAPSSNSNADFLRGFLVGVDSLKSDHGIDLKVIDASHGLQNAATDSLLRTRNLIVGVYESNFPVYLANLARESQAEVINVLDSKSNLYETNPAVVQILEPMDYFSDVITTYLHDNYADRQILFVGDIDRDDKVAEALESRFPTGQVSHLSLEEFNVYPFAPGDKYMVYSYATKKDPIDQVLTSVVEKQNQGLDMMVVGRSVWVAHAQALSELFGSSLAFVPSRFVAYPSSARQHNFSENFHHTYNKAPSNSYPQYAMLGYDIASYFIPTTAENRGDYNVGLRYRPGLQNDIDIHRLNTWSGFINGVSYMLKYLPENVIETIEIQ